MALRTGNPFNPPNPGTPEEWLAYLCVEADYRFRNTANNWLKAYRLLSRVARGDARAALSMLRDRKHAVWSHLRRRRGALPAGALVPVGEYPAGPYSFFAFASRIFDYLQPELKIRLLQGKVPDYALAGNDRRSKALCACHFVERARHHSGGWRRYFNPLQPIGGNKGYLFASERDEIDGFFATLASQDDCRAPEYYRIVGKPMFGAATLTDFSDCAVRMQLRFPDTGLYVPSLIDAEGYAFFLPNGSGRLGRSGRTLYVGWPPTYPVRDGVDEWVHRQLTLDQCLVDLESVGPLSETPAPPNAPAALLAILRSRE